MCTCAASGGRIGHARVAAARRSPGCERSDAGCRIQVSAADRTLAEPPPPRRHRRPRTGRVGGPLGAYLPTDQFDTPFGYEEFDGQGALIGHAGVVVFDEGADMLKMARFAMEFCAVESCGKCTPCRIGAVRGMETIDRIGQGDASAVELLTDLCETMKEGSLCALGGFTPYPVMSALTHFPDDFPVAKEAAE